MNCRKFESKLEQFLTETLSPVSMQECRAHLESCSSCRELYFWAAKESVVVEPSLEEDLIQSVLKKTSGGSCGQAHELLPDFVDNELSPVQRELVDRHLEKCSSCQQICKTMEELAEELPCLAEIDPGKSFTAECLLTFQSFENRFRPQKPMFNLIWSRLLARPRFAWEAAYVLTLAFFIIFKTLAFIPGQSPAESNNNLQVIPAQAYVSVAGAIEEQYGKLRVSVNTSQTRWLEASLKGKTELFSAISWVSDKTGQYWRSASVVAVDLPRSIWNGVVSTFEGIFQKTGPKPENSTESEPFLYSCVLLDDLDKRNTKLLKEAAYEQ